MAYLPRRSALARALVLLVPLALGAGAASFGGCSNLVNPIGGADGGGTNPEDGGPIGTGDAPVVVLTDSASDDAGPIDAGDCPAENATLGAPQDLQCTGLYSNFATKTVAAGIVAYNPGLTLWADGATVARYILLPSGQKIDTTDMNEWTFPVGTKVWQEFQIAATRIETRWYWKRGPGDWVRGPYVWSADGASSATYTTTGVTNVGGSSYDVPPVGDCDTCHSGRIDRLLGVEAVSLAQTSASGVTIATLTTGNQLTVVPPAGSLVIPDDGTGLAAPALSWLHANCGTSCHSASPAANAASTGLLLRLDVAQGDAGLSLGDVYQTNTYVTSVNVTPQLDPFSGEGWHRITPNDAFEGGIGTSLVPFAAGSRGVPSVQMPPIDTAVTDVTDLNALRSWITRGNFPAGTF
jgi:hypothetical protein